MSSPQSQGKVKVTRGGLQPGKIKVSSEKPSPTASPDTNIEVNFLFNPTEYTLKKSNTWKAKENGETDGGGKQYEYTQGGSISLSLTLHFDTLMLAERDSAKAGQPYDVRFHTDNLWRMMEPIDMASSGDKMPKEPPPLVEFVWGKLTFVSYIKSLTQKFTLFRDDGVPVRCEVQIELVQFNPNTSITQTNLKAPKPSTVIDSSRADLLAALSLGMTAAVVSSAPSPGEIADKTRSVMESNGIDDPLSLSTGSQIDTA